MKLIKYLIVILAVVNIRFLVWVLEHLDYKTIKYGLGKIEKFMDVETNFNGENTRLILKQIIITFKPERRTK